LVCMLRPMNRSISFRLDEIRANRRTGGKKHSKDQNDR